MRKIFSLKLRKNCRRKPRINDAIYELEFRQAVQQGLDELDRGEGIPIEQVKAKIAAWAGK